MTSRSLRRLALLVALWISLLAALPVYAASPSDYDTAQPANLIEDYLYGESAIAVDADTGRVLFSKNSRVRMYPASTTKMMTMLLAVESGYDLDTQVTLPAETNNYPQDSSRAGVYKGDTMTFRDLLYGMMLPSGNDAANAVAVLLGGSVENFVQQMNDRAQALGCTGTHFVNAHGYHDENHYSTAQDLAIIASELLKYDEARQIVATPSYTIKLVRNGQEVDLPVANSNSLLREGSTYYFSDCIGIKTGTHSRAGKCFVGAAEKDGVTIVTVTLKCSEDNQKWIDTIRLFRYGFTCYTPYTLEQLFRMAGSRFAAVRISNAKNDDPQGGLLELDVAQISDTGYERMIQTNDEGAMAAALDDFVSRSALTITDNLVAPITAGEIVGTYTYTLRDGQTITASLVAARDVEAQPEPMTIYDIFPFLRVFSNPLVLLLIAILALLILSIALYSRARRRRIERRRRELYERRLREQRYSQMTSQAARRASRPPQPVRRPSTRVPERRMDRPQGRSTTVRREKYDDWDE